MEWRPIQDAPKNPEGQIYGPEIIVWDGVRGKPLIAKWGFYNEIGGWIVGPSQSSGGSFETELKFTHWMELPDPPEDAVQI